MSASAPRPPAATVGATAPSATRASRDPVAVQHQADAAADDGDVHLGARDEAQIGVEACAGRAGRKIEATISPFFSEVLPGPVATCPTGTSRVPSGPIRRAVAPAAIIAGTLSAAGEALQRLPASVARPWIWVEPIRLAASTTPGQAARGPHARPAPRPARRRRCASRHPRARDVEDAADALDVDDQVGLDQPRAELHQHVRAARQHPGGARSRRTAARPPARACPAPRIA